MRIIQTKIPEIRGGGGGDIFRWENFESWGTHSEVSLSPRNSGKISFHSPLQIPEVCAPNFRKIVAENFLSIWFFSLNLRNFWLNSVHLGNSIIFGFSENFSSWNFRTSCSRFKTSRFFLVEWKASYWWLKLPRLSTWAKHLFHSGDNFSDSPKIFETASRL